ncbi:MAG: biotin-dependent carboxyltransferase family protein [Chthoniobacterales bacterium]
MNSGVLRVLAAGPGVTIQDGGRRGFLRFGVTESGPMDRFSHATVNRAAGVALDSAVIEVSLGGAELAVEGMPVTLSVAGGSFDIRLDDKKLPPECLVRMHAGQKFALRAGSSGAWCYVGIAGRFELQPTLGSVSMHTRSSIGGNGLHAGDAIRVISSEAPPQRSAAIIVSRSEVPQKDVRVVLGPQDDYFDAGEIAAFFNTTWRVSNRTDRMAYLLQGPPLRHATDFNIVSDGTAAGSIQIPGDGRPIVLMADRPPTGGYPKIATVIGADLGRLAQLRPGQGFRFEAVSIREAVLARRRQIDLLEAPISLRPLRDFLQPTALLSKNLVDGVTNGFNDVGETNSAEPNEPKT